MRDFRRLLASFLLLAGLAMPQDGNAATPAHPHDRLAPTPPMGWMTWNLFKEDISDKLIREIADAMVAKGYRDAGYTYIFIDDAWQGGRDNRNNIIPDPKKFPYGIKALADYVHSKGLKLGIYSDAAPLTCAGYTASLGFEEQDAKTFASWGIDYLKYDYCNAPVDVETAKRRYAAMAKALRNSGRDIVLGVCEWGPRHPWRWAYDAGGSVWRTTYDVRDMWKDVTGQGGMGILDIINQSDTLSQYAGRGHWNDLDMLVVGLDGKGGPSSDLGGKGCTADEYRTQMSMWCMLSSPLAMTNDLRNDDPTAKDILLNKDIIAINQDDLCQPAVPKGRVSNCRIYLRSLSGNRWAIAVMNDTDKPQRVALPFAKAGIRGRYSYKEIWTGKSATKASSWKGSLRPHQTAVFLLSK